MKVKLGHRVEYAALRTAIFVANLLPETLAYECAALGGRLFFRCSKRRQGIALRMLRNAYPGRDDRELLALGRRATGNVVKVLLDMLRLGRIIERGQLDGRVDESGVDFASITTPFLGVTGHLGSWEVMAAWGAHRFGGADVVVQTIRNPLVHRLLVESRGRAGLRLHPRRGGIRGLARALDAGRLGLQAVDQNQRLRGVFVPWFGELASSERAAASLALRKGVPIAIGCFARVGRGFRFKVHMEMLPPLPPTGDRDDDVEQVVRQINAKLEELVLLYPEQYLWIHDRYRTRPPTETTSDHTCSAS